MIDGMMSLINIPKIMQLSKMIDGTWRHDVLN